MPSVGSRFVGDASRSALALRLSLGLAAPAAAAHRGLGTGVDLAGEVCSGRPGRLEVVVVALSDRDSALATTRGRPA